VYNLTGWSVAFTWQAAVIAAVVLALPLMVLSARAAIESVNPHLKLRLIRWVSWLATFFHDHLAAGSPRYSRRHSFKFRRRSESSARPSCWQEHSGKTQTIPLAITSRD
jgi:molybdate transport system permease protein